MTMEHPQYVIQKGVADFAWIQSRWRIFEIIVAELFEPTMDQRDGRSSNVVSSSVEAAAMAREPAARLWAASNSKLDSVVPVLAALRKDMATMIDSPIGREIAAAVEANICDGRGLPGFTQWGEPGCSNPIEHKGHRLCGRCEKRLQRWQERNRGGIVTR